MLIAVLITNILILLGLCLGGMIYFKETYTIIRLEEWNEIVKVYNQVIEQGILDDIQDGPVPELAGGYGFFKEQIEEPEDGYEEDS